MKSSRTSLNKPFYDWIKQVREADKKIAELEDKLYYYNVKLIGYNSPNFEPRLSSTKAEYRDNKYIWIDKITYLEKKLKSIYKLKEEYIFFLKQLTTEEKDLLRELVENKVVKTYYGRSYKYYLINKISFKYVQSSL